MCFKEEKNISKYTADGFIEIIIIIMRSCCDKIIVFKMWYF